MWKRGGQLFVEKIFNKYFQFSVREGFKEIIICLLITAYLTLSINQLNGDNIFIVG